MGRIEFGLIGYLIMLDVHTQGRYTVIGSVFLSACYQAESGSKHAFQAALKLHVCIESYNSLDLNWPDFEIKLSF